MLHSAPNRNLTYVSPSVILVFEAREMVQKAICASKCVNAVYVLQELVFMDAIRHGLLSI